MDTPDESSSNRSNSTDTGQNHLKEKPGAGNRAGCRVSYVLAYPAPVFTDKAYLVKHLRPRLYLQLQRPSLDGRHHEPVIDVMSRVPLMRSKRMISGLKKSVRKLTSHGRYSRFSKRDVFLVDSTEKGEGVKTENTGIRKVVSGVDALTERNVVAVLRKNDDIVTEDGQIWTASTRPNKSFEFTTINKHGEKFVARWVSTKSQRTKASITTTPPPSPQPGAKEVPETTFHFSLIDPSTRRHAVLATLSPSNLVVKGTYQEPASALGGSDDGDVEVRVVDETTRTLILATAVWLDLHLGWSPSYEAIRK